MESVVKYMKKNKGKELEQDFIKEKVKNRPGVYIIYADKKFNRLRGKTKILYIGKGKNLLKRMLTFPHGFNFLEDHKENPKIAKVENVFKRRKGIKRFWRLKKFGFKLSFKFQKTGTKELAKELEKNQLEKFETKHLELPPLNHAN